MADARNRSRITNGTDLLPGVNGRSAAARRFRDLVHEFAADLGGLENLSATETALVRQAAALTVQSEQLAARIVRGEPVDADESVRLANVAGRSLRSLMEKRAKRPSGPSLSEYLAERAGQ